MAYTRVNKVIIGRDIDVADLTAGWTLQDAVPANVLGVGEVAVLDANKQPLAPGDEYGDSPQIYIAVGTANTFVDPETGDTHREIEVSDPIDGKHVLVYGATDYEAPVQQIATIDFGTLVPEIGEEYAIKFIYKDLYEHPANYSHTYRVTATSIVLVDLVNAFVARIAADKKARVSAANVGGDLVVTALEKPGNTTLNTIDDYSQVTFEVALFSDNYSNDTAVTITPAVKGSGNAAQVRDAEKHNLSRKGITNRTNFPVIMPALKTDMAAEYDLITIIYDREYISADNQYVKSTPLLTQIYLPEGTDQRIPLLASLNPWMASLPRPFANIA
jgi:hypothetical protein